MIDIKLLRENVVEVRKSLEAKKAKIDLDRVLFLDEMRRTLATKIDTLKATRNSESKRIGALLKQKGATAHVPVGNGEIEELTAKVRNLGEEIKAIEDDLAEHEKALHELMLRIPNLPHASVPVGHSEHDNRVLREWGTKPEFSFAPQFHWDLGAKLGTLDLAAGAKLSGSGFYVLKGAGARLERALISWMIDVHTSEHGYTEIMPPHLVTSEVMTGTGQLPKMAEDMYQISGDDFWLIPTAEVPVTNMHREEILEASQLPIRYVAHTPCFRREAGSYGKEVRGITRVHQFNKVEMVQFAKPEDSYDTLETLRGHAETLLQKLGLHYRVVELCTGDLSFAAAKCYDLEVWAPGMNLWLEVSSCSNFEDFQARRANIRYRPEKGAKPKFLHTLNGSGLALPRCVIAVMETYQQADGTIRVPEVLVPYMKAEVIE